MDFEVKKLQKTDIQNFWIKLYFGTNTSNELLNAVIDRAYRDFNRTLHGLGENQTKNKYNNLRNVIKGIVQEIDKINFQTQDNFDQWHKSKCDEIISSFANIPYQLSYGQAQKWLNMTLKYLTALSFDTKDSIKSNYHFFHIPIDNIIQEQLEKYGIIKIKNRWSRINDYKSYLDYQKEIREKFCHNTPLEVEFVLFNKALKYKL
jgi:hypothetical protein